MTEFLFGMKLIEDRHGLTKVAKIKLSPECPVGEIFRNEFNAWLAARFGYTECMFIIDRNSAALGPKALAAIRNLK